MAPPVITRPSQMEIVPLCLAWAYYVLFPNSPPVMDTEDTGCTASSAHR